jgi:DNA invertase Pin-like site-specific DNA recombinase
MKPAIAYLRTSSAANIGADKHSETRQREAIEAFATANGFEIVASYYDSAVKGSDAIGQRRGFRAALEHIAGNGVCTIIVESPDRFARDLSIQIAGHDLLKKLGVALVPTTCPDFFTEESPTATMVRNILGAVAQFEKANLVMRLKKARDAKARKEGFCGGHVPNRVAAPEAVALARKLSKQSLTLREISAELAAQGYLNRRGSPYAAKSIACMLE